MQIDAMIRSMIESDDDWSEKDKIIQSVPGIGPKTSQVLISAMPELGGELDRQEIAALAGVAPYDQDSGRKHGKRRIRGGRANVRSALYMAAFNVVRQKGRFKDFFEGLQARGKSYKVAMVAVMRKLLSTLNVIELFHNRHGTNHVPSPFGGELGWGQVLLSGTSPHPSPPP